ncbi:hypothetical protein PG993_011354 [Apiospora rasikravindrae]|uniref:DUF5672 domain-containing protein n=1 Tax=Apiospora rasikravindrae TaxID=990691 RepID=A0ABR1SE36_9PEZI
MTSYVRDALAEAKPPTDRERVLMDHKLPITPLRQPLLPFPNPAKLDARSYIEPHRKPGSKEIAEWNKELFQGFDGGSKDHLVSEPLRYWDKPSVAPPIRPGAPTIITTFSWEEDMAEGQGRAFDEYLPRIRQLAETGEMVIFYTNKKLREIIEAMRPNDPYWHVVTPWDSVWDVPNNRHQRENFTSVQPKLFSNFSDVGPVGRYNVARLSAAYNAKAYCIFDGVQRAPFGTAGPFMFYDAGWFAVGSSRDPGFAEVAADFIDDAKAARSAAFAGDTGVVEDGPPFDVNHRCFTDPDCAWKALHFLGGSVVGSALGMLNYAVRFMQTVEDMDANRFYVGREEFVMSFLACRYPNTLFSVPAGPTPGFRREWPIRDCHSGRWGPDDLGEVVDPVQTLFCRFYQPRRPSLPAVPGKKRLALKEQQRTPPETPK